jgi:hypothetical protein
MLTRRSVAFLILAFALSVHTAAAQTTSYGQGTEGEIWQQLTTFGPAQPGCVFAVDRGGVVDNNGLICVQQNGPVCGTIVPDPPAQPYQVCGVLPSPTQMAFPIGIGVEQTGTAFFPAGTAFVTDQFNNLVRVFAPNGTQTDLPTNTAFGQPEAIIVDAAHQIIVADSANSRVVVLNPDASLRYVMNIGGNPTGLAITPASQLTHVDGSSPNAADHQGRFVVTDKYAGIVYVFDSDGLPITTLGTAGTSDQGNSQFTSPSNASFDTTGQHLLIADIDTAWTQVFDRNGQFQFQFASTDGSQRAYAATFDHLNRAVISDTENQELRFYQLDYTNHSATLLFSLDARGDLNGFPRGVAELTIPDPQNPGKLLDERILVIDTTNHRVQRFQIPGLAVIDVTVSPSTSSPGTGAVSFRVAVPDSKPGVASVLPSLTSPVATIAGPTQTAPLTIGSGQVATFSYTYSRPSPTTFTASARGNPDPTFPDGYATHSNTVTASETVPCVGCASTATVISPAISASGWYRGQVSVALNSGGGAAQIFYEFDSCPETAINPGVHALSAAGGTIIVQSQGTQNLIYWAVGPNGEEELPHHTLTMKVDFSAPGVQFTMPPNFTTDPQGVRWYHRAASGPAVTIAWSASDSGSGTPSGFTPTPFTFNTEGRSLSANAVVTDIAGNTATVSSSNQQANGFPFSIDTTAPTVTVPNANQTLTVELTGPNGVSGAALAALVNATASDPVLAGNAGAGSGVASITNNAPSTFTTGTITPVTFFAVDYAGNVSTGIVKNIVVRDTVAPTLSCAAANLTLNLGATGALPLLPDLTTLVTASDLSGSVTVTQSVAVNTPLALGARSVTITAKDPSNNQSTCTATITVLANGGPTFTVPANVTIPATSDNGAPYSYALPLATDSTGGHPTVTCTPASGSTFPIGTTTVTCSSADRSANLTTHSFTVTVTPRNSAPVCTAAYASPGSLWPPNHKLVPVSIKGVTDADNDKLAYKILSIFQDEPTNSDGDGATAIDGFGVGTSQASVRAERAGTRDGRVYYINFSATDTAGASCTGTVTIGVPHDQAHAAVGQGPKYDSTRAGPKSGDDTHDSDDDTCSEHAKRKKK